MLNFFEYTNSGVMLHLKVTPNSKENKILGILEEGFFSSLKVAISAQPEKGKANKEIIKFLADKLGITKTSITIKKGQTSQKKLVMIEGKKDFLETKVNSLLLPINSQDE